MPNDDLITDIKTVRPTKKQRALLEYIAQFINEHGYSPCYREIMNGLGYTSVATVSLHVTSLISRGHLQKRDHSARSLEVISDEVSKPLASTVKPADEKWLVELVENRFIAVEASGTPAGKDVDNLYVLVGALKVLGLDGAAQSFIPRLTQAKNRST